MNRNHLLLAVTIALVSSPAAAEHEPSHRTVGSYSIYAGVVSAGVMAFRQDHGERYRIELNIRRAGGAAAVEAAFEYRHRL